MKVPTTTVLQFPQEMFDFLVSIYAHSQGFTQIRHQNADLKNMQCNNNPYTAKRVSWEEEGLIHKKTKITNEISLIYSISKMRLKYKWEIDIFHRAGLGLYRAFHTAFNPRLLSL